MARSREWTTTAAGSTRMRWSSVMPETLKNVEPFADDEVLPEVAVQMHVVVRHQAIHAHIFAQVGAGRSIQAGVTGAAGNDAGDDLVPQRYGISGGVF